MKITEPLLCGSECSGTDGFRDSNRAAAAFAAVVLFALWFVEIVKTNNFL